ncbi:protein-export membrane protein SecF [Candidatus Peribacteria bacterium RIFCSPHIGHO2_02_FULL_53_20]|nr:MAG: protein-export membrane protein SecF [Candidatus Peribacteria bacterium RIFCSPHIGHO2_02_FULL_53_20]OGJ68076.1 MAG: protein-export membrane protein SecF [Candidatus Peribacteria bacterium RIFCSPLOWO2_01_FULL_53_10]OGJ73238.1 MAG: protein-export membrane protein SecF [Candidatus Peribacteria bacterium RIFCSPLOWO2_12_FULL_53_10]
MSFLHLSKFFIPLSLLLVAGSIFLMIQPGPEFSIEFTGGTLVELKLPEGETKDDLVSAVQAFTPSTGIAFGNIASASTKDGTVMLRMRNLSNEEHVELLGHLQTGSQEIRELQYTTIGPTVGASLKKRAGWALIVASLAIIIYLAAAFRKIPGRMSPWSFGIAAVVALLHDIIITVGVFIIIGWYTTFEVDTLYVSALLSIMGYSVNDTIVIFDRIRSNLITDGKRESLESIVDRSLLETLTRTMNTGIGALIMLLVLFFFAAESIRWFILTLIVGTIIGTYSSFFVASPMLVWWQKRRGRKT